MNSISIDTHLNRQDVRLKYGQTASVSWVLGVLLKDCYDSSSPLGCGQQSVRERGVTGSSLQSVARPSRGQARAVRRMRTGGQAGSGGQQGSAGRGEWPVSVPGGQSWCDHSVSGIQATPVYTAHCTPTLTRQILGTKIKLNVSSEKSRKVQVSKVKVKCRFCFHLNKQFFSLIAHIFKINIEVVIQNWVCHSSISLWKLDCCAVL